MQQAHAEMRDNLRKEGRLPEIDLSEARAGASVWAMDAAEAYLRREAERAAKADKAEVPAEALKTL